MHKAAAVAEAVVAFPLRERAPRMSYLPILYPQYSNKAKLGVTIYADALLKAYEKHEFVLYCVNVTLTGCNIDWV